METTAYDRGVTRVLLAEDDLAIAEPLARALDREGYEVNHCASGQEAIDAAPEAAFVVLDLGLPDIDGLAVCRAIRNQGPTIPVLIMTARAEGVALVVGLDAGPNEYVTQPFRPAEWHARRGGLL